MVIVGTESIVNKTNRDRDSTNCDVPHSPTIPYHYTCKACTAPTFPVGAMLNFSLVTTHCRASGWNVTCIAYRRIAERTIYKEKRKPNRQEIAREHLVVYTSSKYSHYRLCPRNPCFVLVPIYPKPLLTCNGSLRSQQQKTVPCVT